MKKWLSVLLSLMLLFTAVSGLAESAEGAVAAEKTAEVVEAAEEVTEAVEEVAEEGAEAAEEAVSGEVAAEAGDPLALAFVDALKAWKNNVNPEEKDYVGTLALMENDFVKAVLRAGNGITEIEVDKPVTGETQEASYAKAALLQYNGADLAIQIGEQTWVIKVQDIVKYLAMSGDNSVETLKAEAQEVKKLVTAFIKDVLSPEITINAESNGLHILFDVNQDQILERMPAFLESLSEDEEQINNLLMKYALGVEINGQQIPQTLAEIREFWQQKTENPETVPNFVLKADAALIKPQADQPLQVGLVGHMIYRNDEVDFDSEYLPTNDGGFILNVFADGTKKGEAFSDSLIATRRPDSFAANLYVGGKAYSLTARKTNPSENVVAVTVDLYASEIPDGLEIYGEYDSQSRDLYAGIYLGGADANALAVLDATLQDSGVAGALTVQDERFDFTWTKNNLYYRLSVSPAALNTIFLPEVDAWLFPLGEQNYRFRVDVTSDTARTMISGTCNPNELKLAVAPFGGDDILDMTLTQDVADEGRQIIADILYNVSSQVLKVDAELKLNAKNQLIYLDGVAKIVNVADGSNQSIYQVSYVPGLATYSDGNNYYELARVEDTASRLIYSLTRNRTKELGTLTCELGEDETLSVVLCWADQVAIEGMISAQKPEIVVPDPVKAPVVIGVLEGVTSEDGVITGILTAPPETEEEPVAEQLKIDPMNTDGAAVIDVKTIAQAGPEIEELVYQLILMMIQ